MLASGTSFRFPAPTNRAASPDYADLYRRYMACFPSLIWTIMMCVGQHQHIYHAIERMRSPFAPSLRLPNLHTQRIMETFAKQLTGALMLHARVGPPDRTQEAVARALGEGVLSISAGDALRCALHANRAMIDDESCTTSGFRRAFAGGVERLRKDMLGMHDFRSVLEQAAPHLPKLRTEVWLCIDRTVATELRRRQGPSSSAAASTPRAAKSRSEAPLTPRMAPNCVASPSPIATPPSARPASEASASSDLARRVSDLDDQLHKKRCMLFYWRKRALDTEVEKEALRQQLSDASSFTTVAKTSLCIRKTVTLKGGYTIALRRNLGHVGGQPLVDILEAGVSKHTVWAWERKMGNTIQHDAQLWLLLVVFTERSVTTATPSWRSRCAISEALSKHTAAT